MKAHVKLLTERTSGEVDTSSDLEYDYTKAFPIRIAFNQRSVNRTSFRVPQFPYYRNMPQSALLLLKLV